MCNDFWMHSRIHAVVVPAEATAFAQETRQIFAELARASTSESPTGECSPPVDVFETDDAVEISVDLPGVDAAAIRVVAKADLLLVAREKTSHRGHAESTFHLVERGFGRFARVVHLGRACDPARARATLANGELRISVPKIADRRGRAIAVPVRRHERPQ